MNRAAVFAWILVALLLIAAVVAVAVKPVHWERTAGVAGLLAVIAAVLAVRYSRRPAGA
jgi:uncharacterized membrane protein YhaH (DUF805 family)